MRRRAEHVAQTRQRIVEAAVHLHGTVGPAGSTIAGIAEQAGVTRLTVYRHFPDEEALFVACSAHWMAQQTPPDPDRWGQITDPEERLREGLTDLYRFYRSGEAMLSRIHRDREHVPERVRQAREAREAHHRDVLVTGFGRGDPRRLRALVGHASSFSTWKSLCVEHDLPDRDAVDAMVALVLSAVGR
jgi:AcrR family transcriptional regulator